MRSTRWETRGEDVIRETPKNRGFGGGRLRREVTGVDGELAKLGSKPKHAREGTCCEPLVLLGKGGCGGLCVGLIQSACLTLLHSLGPQKL